MNIQRIKYILPILIICLISPFFFLQSDESYLKQKTMKLIKMADPATSHKTEMAILRKINEAVKYMHFSVQYKVDLGDYIYEDRSVAELKSLMFTYFKQSKDVTVKMPLETDIRVNINTSQQDKTAEINFSITTHQENKNRSCEVNLFWKKVEKWLIYEITVSKCSITSK